MNPDHTNNEVAAEAILESLQEVISDIDRFMVDWMQRANRCADQLHPERKPDEQLRLQVKEFLTQQRQWESQQKAEQEQLAANAEQLTEAWLRLEAEQRALLQAGNQALPLPVPNQPERRVAEQGSAERAGSLDVPYDQSEPQSRSLQQTLQTAIGRVTMPRDVISPDAAIRQFEILKNELLSTRNQPSGAQPNPVT